MSRRPRTLVQRIRDHLAFSVIAILILFIVLRLLGIRSTFTGFLMSVGITIALNVGLSYFSEFQARRNRDRPAPRGGGDIRWRDDVADPRDDARRDERR